MILFVPNHALFADPLKNFWDNTSSWVKYSVAVVGSGYHLLDSQKKNNDEVPSIKKTIKTRSLRKPTSNVKEITVPFQDSEETKTLTYNFKLANENLFQSRSLAEDSEEFESMGNELPQKDADYWWPFLFRETRFSKLQKQESHMRGTLVGLIMDLFLKKQQEEEADLNFDFLNKIYPNKK